MSDLVKLLWGSARRKDFLVSWEEVWAHQQIKSPRVQSNCRRLACRANFPQAHAETRKSQRRGNQIQARDGFRQERFNYQFILCDVVSVLEHIVGGWAWLGEFPDEWDKSTAVFSVPVMCSMRIIRNMLVDPFLGCHVFNRWEERLGIQRYNTVAGYGLCPFVWAGHKLRKFCEDINYLFSSCWLCPHRSRWTPYWCFRDRKTRKEQWTAKSRFSFLDYFFFNFFASLYKYF